MRGPIVSSVIIAIVALPFVALAQSAPPAQAGDLRQEITKKGYVVLPKPSTEAVADRITAPRRREELLRAGRQSPVSRPELEHSVVNGIQGQQVDRALRSR